MGIRRGTVLIAGRDVGDFFIGALALRLKRLSWHPVVLLEAREIVDAAQTRLPSLIVIDSGIPYATDLTVELKCDATMWRIPVLQILPGGDPERWFASFQMLADSYMRQPFEFSEILAEIDAAVKQRDEDETLRHAAVFRFPNDERSLDRASEVATRLFAQTDLPELEQVQMCTAFREAVLNAAQHGNHYRPNTRIDVTYTFDSESVSVTVRDMGEGFAWQSYFGQDREPIAVCRQQEGSGRPGGLGILLMNKCVDRIEYNRAGNALRLMKHCGGVAGHRVSATASSDKA